MFRMNVPNLNGFAMGDLPFISVMIITYNQADLIEETVNSVLAEPRYPNLEIVIADDCSTDHTRAVLERIRAAHPDIVRLVLNEKNLGITGNSNAAFFATRGELVAVMGGDDLFLPEKLQAQAAQFVADPKLVLSYHPVEIFEHGSGKVLAVTDQKAQLEKRSAYDIIEKGGIPGASSMVVRRSACPDYGFDPHLPVVSDWKFAIDVAFNGRVEMLDGIYGRYRKTGTGASERTFQLLDESLRTLELVLKEHPGDPRLQLACNKGAARYIAGEVYRSIVNKPERALPLANRMIGHHKSLLYCAVWLAAFLTTRLPFFRKTVMHLGKAITSYFK